MEKKYEILKDKNTEVNGITLYRIKALKDFGDVKNGEIGGYIENESNLSQENDCWIYDDAMVYNYAKIFDNGKVFNNAKVYGTAQIYENAKAYTNPSIFGNSRISGNVCVFGDANVFGSSELSGNAKVYGSARVYDAIIRGRVEIFNNAEVCNFVELSGTVWVYGDAKIIGRGGDMLPRLWIGHDTRVFSGNISSNDDYISYGPVNDSQQYATIFKSGNNINVCSSDNDFKGTLDEFRDKFLDLDDEEYLGLIKILNKKFKIHK